MARKEVVAKRGCTCCGTGCVIPAAVVPLVSFGLSGMIGWAAAAVVALPAALGATHLLVRLDSLLPAARKGWRGFFFVRLARRL